MNQNWSTSHIIHFSIKKRSVVEFNISAIDRNSEITYAHIEKKENGQWKRIDDTVKIKPASYDDDFVHGLTKGELPPGDQSTDNTVKCSLIYKQF